MPPLHNQRRRLADRATREANGESFWTAEFSTPARTRLAHMLEGWEDSDTLKRLARDMILKDEALNFLASPRYGEEYDFDKYLEACDSQMVPTVLEALSLATVHDDYYPGGEWARSQWESGVNAILERERISFELTKSEMVPFTSRELHVEVVQPALALLANPGWADVELAYRAALAELSRGEGANAVTDAGTALQVALEKAGATGNALGPLIVSARKKNILAAHDGKLAEVILAAATWVSADRSITGDAHNVAPASSDDAWLTVHVVGALLLRLSRNAPRSPGA